MLKHYIARFWARNMTTYRVLFFVYHLAQKFVPPQTVIGQWHPSLDPQSILISSWLGWKGIYVETLYSAFLSAKIENVSSTFFVYQLGQKLLPPQTVLGQWNSSLDPQFIWISPWLRWKAIYVETLYSAFFCAKFDNVSNNCLVCQLCRKFFHPQTVLRQWHSSLDPQFIWISPWLGWKAIYVETLKARFWARKLTTHRVLFCIPPSSKILSPSDCTRTVTLLARPSIHLNKSLTTLKSDLCWNTI